MGTFNKKLLIGSLLVCTILAVLFLPFPLKWSLKHYSGDGELSIMPDHGLLLGGEGSRIKFKPIKLDHPSQSSYHFSGLPAWHFETFFTIEDSRDWTDAGRRDLNGILAMSLKDVKGNVIFQFKRRLSDLIWSRAGLGPWDLYDLKSMGIGFTPNESSEYIIEIAIDPDPTLKDDIGYVLLRGGGHEGIP